MPDLLGRCLVVCAALLYLLLELGPGLLILLRKATCGIVQKVAVCLQDLYVPGQNQADQTHYFVFWRVKLDIPYEKQWPTSQKELHPSTEPTAAVAQCNTSSGAW